MSDPDPPEQPPVLPWARPKTPVPGGPAAAPGPGGPAVTAAGAIAAGFAYRGNLGEDSPLRLLYLGAAASATGRLDLRTERGAFVLYLRRGVVEHAASDAPADHLGAHLVRRGVVSPEALARAEAIRASFDGDLVAALVSFDAFRPARDFALLQEHGGTVVTSAIASTRGTVEWTPGATTAVGFPIATRWGLVCEATRRLDVDTARKLLRDRLNRIASRTRGRVDVTELKLIPQEARTVALFDGRISPAQVAAARPADAALILKVALLLAETELLQFGAAVAEPPPPARPPAPFVRPPPPPSAAAAAVQRAEPTAPPPAPAVAKVTAPPPAPSMPPPAARPTTAPTAPAPPKAPAPPPAPRDDRASLEAFHRKLEGADHFEVLGAARGATVGQLKVCYFQLAKRYHPDAGPPGEPPDVKKLRADIFGRISEAWGVLGNEHSRADYLDQLETNLPPNVDVAHILKAEEIFRKATVLVRARHYAQALTTIEQAIELNPDEPEFGVWLAWIRFLLSTARDAQRAASSTAIEAALEKAPRCIAGYLFLAQMARNTGDVASAERHLKRGLAVAPHHEELARELKFLAKTPRK